MRAIWFFIACVHSFALGIRIFKIVNGDDPAGHIPWIAMAVIFIALAAVTLIPKRPDGGANP